MLKTVEQIAKIYECELQTVLDLLDEGFTLEEAEEIIKEAEV